MYQALYRKYRPRTFDEVVGQSGVTQTLKAQLSAGRLSHAYLFTGSRGTGKTSCAKILAKAVNCEHPEGGNPCNRCAACRSIDSGSCMDVLEIDAASNNGVDNVRSLRDDAIYPPAEVKMRVYIIDEVHMLSISAFNALLKLIEEPPAHLLFILATTELHKVPATILSRCQRFSFRRLLPEDIGARINECALREGIEIDDRAIALLSRLADGAMRDGMSLLDQCASASDGRVTADTVYRCLGLAGERNTARLLSCIADGDRETLLSSFSSLYSSGKDLGAMVDELTGACRDLLIMKTAPKAPGLISGVTDPALLDRLLPRFTAEQLLRMTTLLQDTASGFNRSASRRIDVELCLLRLCDPHLDPDPAALADRLSRLEALAASGMPVRTAVPEPPAGPEAPPPQDADAPPWAEDAPPWAEDAPPRTEDAPPAEVPAPSAAPQAPAAPSDAHAAPEDFWQKLCAVILPGLSFRDQWMFRPEARERVHGRLDGSVLRVAACDVFTMGMAEKLKDTIAGAARQLLGGPVRVVFSVGDEKSDPAQDSFVRLLERAKEYPDIIHIKE